MLILKSNTFHTRHRAVWTAWVLAAVWMFMVSSRYLMSYSFQLTPTACASSFHLKPLFGRRGTKITSGHCHRSGWQEARSLTPAGKTLDAGTRTYPLATHGRGSGSTLHTCWFCWSWTEKLKSLWLEETPSISWNSFGLLGAQGMATATEFGSLQLLGNVAGGGKQESCRTEW